MVTLFIDADACPVKDEVYKVAVRYQAPVFVVSNSWIRTPRLKLISQIVVDQGPDVADDWIAERADAAAIVITADIPLADRVLKAGGQAIHPTGRVFTVDNIGAALSSRVVGEHLRSMGEITGGPKPFTPADRSKFLQALDAAVVRAKRAEAGASPSTPSGSPSPLWGRISEALTFSSPVGGGGPRSGGGGLPPHR